MRKAFLFGAALVAALPTIASAQVTVHVERNAQTQARIAEGTHLEDFSTTGGRDFTSNFGGSPANAVFSGFEAASGAAVLGAGQAVIKLDRAVGYLGYRAALDENNTIELFAKGESLGYFNFVDSPEKTGIVGSALAWGIANMMAGSKDAGPAPFTYLNFFSETAFDEIRFTQKSGTFAVDDVRVGSFAAPNSVSNSAVPESGTWALMIIGFGVVGSALRRSYRVKGVRFA